MCPRSGVTWRLVCPAKIRAEYDGVTSPPLKWEAFASRLVRAPLLPHTSRGYRERSRMPALIDSIEPAQLKARFVLSGFSAEMGARARRCVPLALSSALAQQAQCWGAANRSNFRTRQTCLSRFYHVDGNLHGKSRSLEYGMGRRSLVRLSRRFDNRLDAIKGREGYAWQAFPARGVECL
jgi:hypothetical protein